MVNSFSDDTYGHTAPLAHQPQEWQNRFVEREDMSHASLSPSSSSSSTWQAAANSTARTAHVDNRSSNNNNNHNNSRTKISCPSTPTAVYVGTTTTMPTFSSNNNDHTQNNHPLQYPQQHQQQPGGGGGGGDGGVRTFRGRPVPSKNAHLPDAVLAFKAQRQTRTAVASWTGGAVGLVVAGPIGAVAGATTAYVTAKAVGKHRERKLIQQHGGSSSYNHGDQPHQQQFQYSDFAETAGSGNTTGVVTGRDPYQWNGYDDDNNNNNSAFSANSSIHIVTPEGRTSSRDVSIPTARPVSMRDMPIHRAEAA